MTKRGNYTIGYRVSLTDYQEVDYALREDFYEVNLTGCQSVDAELTGKANYTDAYVVEFEENDSFEVELPVIDPESDGITCGFILKQTITYIGANDLIQGWVEEQLGDTENKLVIHSD